MDYNKLKPGLYLQRGEQIKSLEMTDRAIASMLMGRTINDLEKLVAGVGWVFIALNKRKNQMGELFSLGEWMRRSAN